MKATSDHIDSDEQTALEKKHLLSGILKKPGPYTPRNSKKRSHIDNLFSELVEMVAIKQFKKAEELRKKIFEVDSMATNEIVQSGILIENEKKKYQVVKPLQVLFQSERAFADPKTAEFANATHHQTVPGKTQTGSSLILPDIWKELYETMNADEINIFTSTLKPVLTNTSKTLLKQKMLNNNLYFINSGQIKVIGVSNGGISFKKTLNPGDIAGEDVFFSNTPSPVSVIAAKGAGIDYIKKNDLYQLCSIYPSIGKSLFDYCNKKGKTTAAFYSHDLNQRNYKRFRTSGTADLQLMKSGNINLGKPIHSKVLDISKGGISLEINKIKPEFARKLINMPVNLLLNLNNFNTPILCAGSISGVHRKSYNSYTLHLKWDKANDKLSATINWLANN